MAEPFWSASSCSTLTRSSRTKSKISFAVRSEMTPLQRLPRAPARLIKTKKPPKVCRRPFGHLARWQVSHIPEGLRHFRDKGGLVSPPPVGLWCKEWRVGFDEQMFQWNLPCYVS